MNPRHFKSLELTNYGPFPSLQLSPFGSLVEVSGLNGTGKSYILQAFLAACSGAGIAEEDIYQEAGQAKPNKDSSITIEWYDGRRLELKRKGGTTSWLLYQADGTYEPLSGVKDKGVAKRIQDFTGWQPLTIGEKQEFLNLSPLHRPNLLLQDTSAAMVLKVVNGLAGGGALEEAARLADQDVRRASLEISSTEARYKDLRQQRMQKGLTSLEKALTIARQAEAILDRIDFTVTALNKAKEARHAVADASTELHLVITDRLALEQAVARVNTAKAAFDKTAMVLADLKHHKSRIGAVVSTIEQVRESVKSAQEAQIVAAQELQSWVETVPLGTRKLCGQCGCITCEVKA